MRQIEKTSRIQYSKLTREVFYEAPVIFATGSNTDMDELNSIMLGGDAFITKSYNTAILLAKIAALLRRAYASGQAEPYCWNGAILHLESSLIEYKGQNSFIVSAGQIQARLRKAPGLPMRFAAHVSYVTMGKKFFSTVFQLSG